MARSLESSPESRREQKYPKIEFPKKIESVKKLQDKLKEYRDRLKKESEGFQPAEQVIPVTADTRYKITVLEKVLLEGDIDTDTVAQELEVKDGQFFRQADFDNACGVIKDYCKTGGKENVGGTRLK